MQFIGLALIALSFGAGLLYAGPIIIEDTITTFFGEEDTDIEIENRES